MLSVMHNVKMMRLYILLFSAIIFETGLLFAQNNNKYDELLIRKARILSNEAIAKKIPMPLQTCGQRIIT